MDRVYVEGPPSGSLEARAALALKGLAAIYVVGAVFALIPSSLPGQNLLAVTFNSAALALAVLYVVVARAIDAGRTWAIAAIRPTLLVVVVAGVASIVVALGDGTQRVPYDILLALWAWRGEPNLQPSPRPQRRGAVAIGGAFVLLAAMLVAKPLTGWGGLTDVHAPDLEAAIRADCGAPGAGPPATIAISFDWSWRSTTLLPSGGDIVVVGWTGANADGRPLYVIGETPLPRGGVYIGREGYPSTAMAGQASSESPGSFRWAIDLGEQRLQPGHIDLQLMRTTAAAPDHGTETISAAYVHLGVWRQDTAKVTCTW